MGRDLFLFVSVPLMLGGLAAWMAAAEVARAWLAKHDPAFAPAGTAARLLAGGLLTAIGPVRDYARRRRALGQPATCATVFWVGLSVSWGGFALFVLYLLGRR